MAQPLHVPPKPAESAKIRNRLYEMTMNRMFKQVWEGSLSTYVSIQFFIGLVVVNSATLIVPWNVDEENERETFLYLSTGLSAMCNVLFAVEVLLPLHYMC